MKDKRGRLNISTIKEEEEDEKKNEVFEMIVFIFF
jgi:hypothetical protein